MPSYRFDPAKSFDANFREFLNAIEQIDPEMAAILRENADALAAIIREGERDTKARAEFNAAVLKALDALAAAAPDKEGGNASLLSH